MEEGKDNIAKPVSGIYPRYTRFEEFGLFSNMSYGFFIMDFGKLGESNIMTINNDESFMKNNK